MDQFTAKCHFVLASTKQDRIRRIVSGILAKHQHNPRSTTARAAYIVHDFFLDYGFLRPPVIPFDCGNEPETYEA